LKHRRAAVGFYKDRDGETRPITKSEAEVNRKRVVQNSRRFEGVTPKTDKFRKANRQALQIAKRTVADLGGQVKHIEIVGGAKTAKEWRKDIDVLVTVTDIKPLLHKKFPRDFIYVAPHRPAIDIFLVDLHGQYAHMEDTIYEAEAQFVKGTSQKKS